MKGAIIRNTRAPGFGVTVAWVSLIASSNVVVVATVQIYFGALLPTGPAGNEGSVVVSLSLLGGLVLAYVPWILAVVRGWLPATSCGGLVLASCGLSAYAVAESGRWWIGALGYGLVGTEIHEALEAVLMLGLVAYVAGLGLLASACIAEFLAGRGRVTGSSSRPAVRMRPDQGS